MVTDLKLINYEEFDKILAEFDRYVKEKKRGPPSQVQSLLKTEGLTSLIETKPLDRSVFRHMDIRIRVFSYDLRKQFCDNLSKADSFVHFLNTTCREGFDRYSRRLQLCLRIASTDLALKSHLVGDLDALSEADLKSLQLFSSQLRTNFRVERPSKRWSFDATSLSSRNQDLGTSLMDHSTQTNWILAELVRMSISSDGSINAQLLTPLAKQMLQARLQQLLKKFEHSSETILLWAVKLMELVQVSCWDMQPSKPQIASALGVSGLFPSMTRSPVPQISPQKTLKLYMTKLLASGLLRDKKLAETSTIVDQFRTTMKKDGETVKNMELDHLQNMWMNFCKVAVVVGSSGTIQKPPTQKLWVKTPSRPSWNTGWKTHSKNNTAGESNSKILVEASIPIQEINEYFSDTIGSSFVLTQPDTLIASGVFVLGELWKSLVHEQRRLYSVISNSIAELKNDAKAEQPLQKRAKISQDEKIAQITPLSQKLVNKDGKFQIMQIQDFFLSPRIC